MHTLFGIPELLRLIFEQLGRKDRACCAQVCQGWAEVALDVLWYKMTMLNVALFFGPLRTLSSLSYELEHPPSPEALARFESMYSHRVRILCAGGPGDRLSRLKETYTIGSLLSNLRKLSWNAASGSEISSVVPFLHTGMERCNFTARTYHDSEQLITLMEAISLRCPSLVSLEMKVWPKPERLKPLMSLVTKLPHLEEIKIPSFPDVSQILQALSNRRELKSLRFDFCNRGAKNLSTYVNTVTSSENVLTGGFPSLEELEAYAQESITFSPLFQLDVHRLRSIRIFVGSLGSSVSPKPLLQSISRACPCLVEFSLCCHFRNIDRRQISDFVLDFDDLRDILACTSMTLLEVKIPIHFNLSDSDIQEIAQAFPKLQSLQLYSYMSTVELENAKHLSMQSIFHLVRHCPQIESISLDINASTGETLSHLYAITNTGRVGNLTYLDIGRYPLGVFLQPDMIALAKLLGQLCRPGCSLQYIVDDEENVEWIQELMSRWNNVRILMEHFSGLHSTIHSLELENASLRAQLERST
ncbi:hypothetical protein VKT23_008025 [Stygiomarasmius scandens]|uniref:F-box domain-containing protein n=1 Tax=Marasmiellus scandens TaxID=2682957 RepID=A0ABR1JMC9_9AGAR